MHLERDDRGDYKNTIVVNGATIAIRSARRSWRSAA
jgi:hypothetical protein